MTPFPDTLAPAEKRVLTFDFSADLAISETLTGNPTVAITLLSGVDPTPATLANGAAAQDVSQKMILVPVQANNVDCDYAIKVTSTTSNPLKVLVLIGTLKIRN